VAGFSVKGLTSYSLGMSGGCDSHLELRVLFQVHWLLAEVISFSGFPYGLSYLHASSGGSSPAHV